ncbi:MAG: ROK family transcriptional regulator, partial [Candidatus Promineifilaceae bacterium]
MKKATREQTRAHNKRLLLKTVYQEGEISRAAMARATNLTRTTVSQIVAELIAEGLVEEIGVGPSDGGKPPVLLAIPPLARLIIGVDLADSEFRGAVFDIHGRFLHREHLPVNQRKGDEALELALELIGRLVQKASGEVLGIGVGTPGLVDGRKGIVRQAVNLDWRSLPMAEMLRTRFSLPVYVGNDSHLAALGQYTFGKHPKPDNLLVVKVGRGIGMGIVLNGRLHYGDNSGAGEIGHVRAVENGRRCICGREGCLETVASTRALVERAQQLAQFDRGAYINTLVGTPSEINTNTVLRAALAGDEQMMEFVRDSGYHLGISIAHLVGAFDIKHIVIAGSMARFGEPYLEAI